MTSKINFNVIVPDTAKVASEVEDYIFDNANNLVGMSFNKQGWAEFVANKFGVTFLDVFQTVKYMVKMGYLIEDSMFGTVQLWRVNPEYID